MDLLHLKYFRCVAEMQSVTKAAKHLYVSQPYLSTKIRELEQELGILLFDRKNRRIYLSDAGAVFLEYVKRIELELDTAVARMEMIKQASEEYERLVVAASSCGFFQPIIMQYNQNVSKVAVSHLVMSNRQMFDGLKNDRIEIGLACMPPFDETLEFAPIFVEELVAIMLADHHPELTEECDLRQLRHDKVMICNMMLDEEYLIDVCQKAGFTPAVDLSTNEVFPADIGTLTFDNHVLYAPLHCLDMMRDLMHENGLKVIHIRDYFASMTWGLVFHNTSVFTPEKSRFFKYIDEALKEKITELAERYGPVKNYCVTKKAIQKEF